MAGQPAWDISHAGVLVRWEPETRRLYVHHTLGSTPDEEDARLMIPQITERVQDAPFTMLVNAEGAGGASVGWRVAWNGWFHARRHLMRVAIYNAHLLDRTLVPVFAMLTGTTMRTFPSEDEAAAWLDEAPREAI